MAWYWSDSRQIPPISPPPFRKEPPKRDNPSKLNFNKLLSLYLQTNYTTNDPPFIIRIGERHPKLDSWLKDLKWNTWAYLTAWNPQSIPLSWEENNIRQKGLLIDLQEWPTYSGQGIPDHGHWTPEESFLVLGIPKEEAQLLGKKWGQLAILFGEVGIPADLIWCT